MWGWFQKQLERVFPPAPPPPTNEAEFLAQLHEVLPAATYDDIVSTATPIVTFSFSPADDGLPATASKVGGAGYWPADMPYPTNSKGQNLALLAQLNLGELPSVPGFPTQGLLAFYLDPHKAIWGVSFGAQQRPTGAQVIYFPELKAPNAFPTEDRTNWLWGMPYARPLAIHGTPQTQYMLSWDVDFTHHFGVDQSEWERRHGLNDVDYPEPHHGLSQLGGYPYFTQADPRRHSTANDVLLFQLNSEGDPWDILWGDAGVGNFFIHPDDLRARHFERAWFTWDCG